jgi:hypothetical protein
MDWHSKKKDESTFFRSDELVNGHL